MSDSDDQSRPETSVSSTEVSDPESVLWLIDAEGNDHPHELLEVLDVGEGVYAALMVLDTDSNGQAQIPERTELTFLRIELDDQGEDVLVEIEDDEEVERVFAAWTAYLDGLDS